MQILKRNAIVKSEYAFHLEFLTQIVFILPRESMWHPRCICAWGIT